MKKIISIVLLLAMCLGLFAACGESEPAETTAASDLASAKEYLTSMYQTAKKGEPIEITADKDVLKSVAVAGVSYSIEWSVEITSGDAGSVTVAESTKENHVKLDIPLHSSKDILFTATATITDPNGATETVSFDFKVAGVKLAGEGMTMAELVAAAYALEQGAALDGLGVLTGVITIINTPYDDGYKNVTVTIQVEGAEDKPIKCYRLKGEGADSLKVGDTITVSGTLKNYNGTIEFDAGCMIDELFPGDVIEVEGPTDPLEIVDAAYAIEGDATLPYESTLTGVITSIDTPYDEGYQNVTVTITVAGREDKPIKCYRLKGEGAAQLAVGDTITVTGTLMKYSGVPQFGQGCTLGAASEGDNTGDNTGETEVPAPTNPKQIVEEAYKLKDGETLPYTATLTGKITKVDTPYDATFGNISVTIITAGSEDKPILCYRLKGTGADKLKVDDTITVEGKIKNYGGVIEFDAGCELKNVQAGNGPEIVVPTDPKDIVDAAYALEKDTALPYNCTLTGTVFSVDDAYNAEYKNITVTIQVKSRESKPIICFRMKGNDIDKIAKGDEITVSGVIKNYNGKIEFDTGCQLVKLVSKGGEVVKQETDPAKIMEAASKLKENTEMSYDVELSGKVTVVDDAYDATYKNITVTMAVSGTRSFLKCYRLKGDNVEKMAVGDDITVKGRIKNHYGEIELTNCTMTKWKSNGGKVEKVETDPVKIVDAAYNLAENTQLSYDAELTGVVTKINTAYDSGFGNITVTIAVSSRESKPIECYRMKGDGVEKICVGDTITVKGRLKNYSGKVEFDAGCEMTNRKSAGVEKPSDPKQIVDAAFALEKGASLPYTATLKGTITEIVDAYSEQYKNITVIIEVEGTSGKKTIECYRMKGDGAADLKVGDVIEVTGTITRYYKDATEDKPVLDKVEFGAGSTFKK